MKYLPFGEGRGRRLSQTLSTDPTSRGGRTGRQDRASDVPPPTPLFVLRNAHSAGSLWKRRLPSRAVSHYMVLHRVFRSRHLQHFLPTNNKDKCVGIRATHKKMKTGPRESCNFHSQGFTWNMFNVLFTNVPRETAMCVSLHRPMAGPHKLLKWRMAADILISYIKQL